MSNLTTVTVRVQFKKGSTSIRANFTKKQNITLTGTVVASDDLIVSSNRYNVPCSGKAAIGMTAIVCIPNEAVADKILDKINATHPANRGAYYSTNDIVYAYLRVLVEGTVIFNKDTEGYDRLTFLDVEQVNVREHIAGISSPQTKEYTPARDYRVVREERKQAEAAANISSQKEAAASTKPKPTLRKVQNDAAMQGADIANNGAALSSQMEAPIPAALPTSVTERTSTPLVDANSASIGAANTITVNTLIGNTYTVTKEEKEILIFGGFNSSDLKELTRGDVDELLVILHPRRDLKLGVAANS